MDNANAAPAAADDARTVGVVYVDAHEVDADEARDMLAALDADVRDELAALVASRPARIDRRLAARLVSHRAAHGEFDTANAGRRMTAVTLAVAYEHLEAAADDDMRCADCGKPWSKCTGPDAPLGDATDGAGRLPVAMGQAERAAERREAERAANAALGQVMRQPATPDTLRATVAALGDAADATPLAADVSDACLRGDCRCVDHTAPVRAVIRAHHDEAVAAVVNRPRVGRHAGVDRRQRFDAATPLACRCGYEATSADDLGGHLDAVRGELRRGMAERAADYTASTGTRAARDAGK